MNVVFTSSQCHLFSSIIIESLFFIFIYLLLEECHWKAFENQRVTHEQFLPFNPHQQLHLFRAQ